jgi:superfamily II DNA/RNA helicase
MEHIYYEVGTSLLAKPQALCDLVEYESGKSCIIFCNSPSDADFADVILKKRGIASVKLIGYVPQLKLSKAIQQLQKKEITALVLTDVAARGVPLEEFEVVVNYSVPVDPEVYFTRYAAEGETKTKKVVSLVAAMDITNFHFLKKLGKVEFVQSEPPTAEQLFVGKFNQLREQAIEKAAAGDTSLNELVEKVLADDKARDIVALLLNNTLTVIPALKAASTPAREERSDFEEEFDEVGQPDFDRQDRGDRRGRDRMDRGGRDRDNRGNRDVRGNRDDRDNRGNRDDRGGRRHRDESFDEGDEGFQGQPYEEGSSERRGGRRGQGGERGDRGDRGDRGERGEGRRQRQREPRKPMVVDKEARLYVGVGSNKGISADALKEQVVNSCGIQATDVHRVSLRGAYAFVDVPESVADQVVEKLGETEAKGTGEKFFVKKAVTLSIPREPTAEELAALQAEDSFSDSRHDEGADSHHDDGGEEGPTLLAVDDQA